jgi:hypothetical protein
MIENQQARPLLRISWEFSCCRTDCRVLCRLLVWRRSPAPEDDRTADFVMGSHSLKAQCGFVEPITFLAQLIEQLANMHGRGRTSGCGG